MKEILIIILSSINNALPNILLGFIAVQLYLLSKYFISIKVHTEAIYKSLLNIEFELKNKK